jgi:5'-nucleotidase
MNKLTRFLLVAAIAIFAFPNLNAEHLIVISANDTHSQIEPASDGLGGLLRRRAAFDEIRRNNKNVIAVHAGDAVQGTLYFSMFKGDVEYAAIDSLGYDIIILGNHEFDNGIDDLAAHYKNIKAVKLSANYDFSDTPLSGVMQPYHIKTVAGKRIGFFGINVDPKGLISDDKYPGMVYLDNGEVAEATAKYLKEVQKVDFTIMVSHAGYYPEAVGQVGDSIIASRSHYIDMIVSAHTHTQLKPGDPRTQVKNADGKIITIGQNGKAGKYIATYDIDLDDFSVKYGQVKLDKSLDAKASYPAMEAWLAPYKFKVDSVMNNVLGTSALAMGDGDIPSQNWLCDAVMEMLPGISGISKIDGVIMNKGGIRQPMPKGDVTEGLMGSMFPFDNRFMVVDVKGSDLLEALRVMATRGGDAVSKEFKVEFSGTGENAKIVSAKLNGKKIDPQKTYTIGSIDYLINGGDHMEALGKGATLFVDTVPYGEHMKNYIKTLTQQGRVVDAKNVARMISK